MKNPSYNKKQCEQLRYNLAQEFDQFRDDWIDAFFWVNPHRIKHLTGKEKGQRDTNHIVDTSHVISHRAMVAGFGEGNTSVTRPWFVCEHPDKEINKKDSVKFYLQTLRDRSLSIASSSNLYHALAIAYSDWGICNTSCIYIDELPKGPHFTVLDPGTYYLMNNNQGIADVLVREWTMTVKNLVEEYGERLPNGEWDMEQFSNQVQTLWKDQMFTESISICEVIKPNNLFDSSKDEAGANRKWVCLTYECGGISHGNKYSGALTKADFEPDEKDKWLRIQYKTRKPFIAFRNESSSNFAYGETGPTTRALGLIKSLNKKAIAKDVAIDLMIKPPLQGPASLKKSYSALLPGQFVPMNATDAMTGGAKRIYDFNPAVDLLNLDAADLRSMVRKLYYEDLMLFLSQNPKTRTAEEVRAVMSEQQLVIGPMLQSLNYTLNTPLAEYLMEYAIAEDPYMPEPPEELAGSSIGIVFISVFAQAQRAADLPSIDRYVERILAIAPVDPTILDKANLDSYADLISDRLYLPAELNRSASEVAAIRQAKLQQQQQMQQMSEVLPAMAKARKDNAQANALMQPS